MSWVGEQSFPDTTRATACGLVLAGYGLSALSVLYLLLPRCCSMTRHNEQQALTPHHLFLVLPPSSIASTDSSAFSTISRVFFPGDTSSFLVRPLTPLILLNRS